MRGGVSMGWLLGALVLGCGGVPAAPPAVPEAHEQPVASPEAEAERAPDFSKLEPLARARDPEGVRLATRALLSAEASRRLLAARALVSYGVEAEGARASLLLASSNEPTGEVAGTMAWALVLLDAEQAAGEVARRLGDGSLQQASNLDAAPVFDLPRLRKYSWRFKADRATHERYLVALGALLGGAELAVELGLVSTEPQRAFFEQKRIFDLLARLNDPGAADALFAFTQQKPPPHPYFETRAAHALASLGDLRAAPLLARRLMLDPLQVYSDEREWEAMLRRDDSERVVSARLLADLAVLHPEARAQLLRDAESSVWAWLHEMPSPHANGLRALAAMGSRRDLAQLRSWADPQVRLPLEGQQPPLPEEWIIAQTALRYVGQLRDAPSRAALLKALQRRPAKLDATMEGLMQGGVAILGMALRAIGVGAAQGLAEWRDPASFGPLLRYVEDPLNNEQSRIAACSALAWVGRERELQQLARRVAKLTPAQPKDRLFRACVLEGLQQRPVPGVASSLLPLLAPAVEPELRHAAARAIGRNALDAEVEQQLERLLQQPELRSPAALALMLGGSSKAAANAFAKHVDAPGANNEELLDAWYNSFAFWSRDDVADGTLFRYVANNTALRTLSLAGREKKPEQLLRRQLANLVFDNGPHSATRVVLVEQLRRVAAGKDERLAGQALDSLVLLDEVGSLLHLSRSGPHAAAARAAHRRALAEGAAFVASTTGVQ